MQTPVGSRRGLREGHGAASQGDPALEEGSSGLQRASKRLVGKENFFVSLLKSNSRGQMA